MFTNMHGLFFLAIALAGGVAFAQSAVPASSHADPLSDAAIDARIRQCRTAEATLTVTDEAGTPLVNAELTVYQTKHKFLFGCNIYKWDDLDDAALQQAYCRRFADVFNYATLPFYWGSYERVRGQPQEERLKAVAKWCLENDIVPKGHPLVWHEVPARWLADAEVPKIQEVQLARIQREMDAFRGLIDVWDVVNEAIVMPEKTETPIGRWCEQIGPRKVVELSFAQARQASPKATLLLNDFRNGPDFVKLLQESLQAGVSIDAIGLQSHMHWDYWGDRELWDICERFAPLGNPLHWTETTILSGPKKNWPGYDFRPGWNTTPELEQTQAENVARFYRVLFSHPAVAAITWWDLSDEGAWLGAPSGLLRKDMSPKPAYETLRKLIKEQWWTGRQTLKTDAVGQVTFRGYLGDYEAVLHGGAGTFTLDKPGPVAASVVLKSESPAKKETKEDLRD